MLHSFLASSLLPYFVSDFYPTPLSSPAILLLNSKDFAISTLAPLFCCNRVATYYCRLVIRIKSCFFWVEGACNARAVDCSIDCYCCCWNMFGSGDGNGDGDDNNSSYKNKWSFLSKLIASYRLGGWNNIISKKGISKLDGPLRGYCYSPI